MSNVTDPWLLNPDGSVDPFANNVDWGANYADLRDPDLVEPDNQEQFVDPALDAHPGMKPEVVEDHPNLEDKPEPEPEPAPAPEPDEPTVTELEDGTQLITEKEKGQWKGTIISPTGGSPQVFWGKTKDGLIANLLKAQANATKKIREQNAKLKFAKTPAPAVQKMDVPTPQNRQLTADEVFEIKTQLESDPALALDTLFQKKTGLTIEQLVSLAQQGSQKAEYASNQLTAEMVNKTFLANTPDYYPDNQGAQNHRQLIRWIAKFKLGQTVSLENAYSIYDQLVSAGVYTVENLEEAFEDLNSDGLMLQAPVKRQPKTPPPVKVQDVEPAPAPRPDPRIVSQVVRPRAATGIGRNDVTPVRTPDTPNAPSVEDLDNMSDEQHQKLWAEMLRHRAQSRRSN